jgi:hypothetical protein
MERPNVGSNPLSHERVQSWKSQLKGGEPGAIFVKLPQHWVEPTNFLDTSPVLKEATNRLFGTTKRVTSVVFYHCPIIFLGDQVHNMILIHEFVNPNHGFDKQKSWELFPTNGSAFRITNIGLSLPSPNWRALARV